MRLRRTLAIGAGAAAIAAGLLTAPAGVVATYPGSTNGRLAFGADLGGNVDIHTVLPNGEAVHRLTTQPGFDACPAFSADGKHIAWCSGVAPTYEIWTMRQDGSEKRQVTNLGGAATFPDYSPDGSQIVFTALVAGVSAGADIFVVDADGENLRRLTDTALDDRYASFSPDGESIVFLSARSGQWQVWRMDADGDHEVQLTFDPVMKDQVPDWSPDGSQIAFVTRLNPAVGGGDIWLMDADGSNQRPLTSGPEPEYGAAWAPDGTGIAYLDLTNRFVHILDVESGERRVVNGFAPQLVPGWQPRGERLN